MWLGWQIVCLACTGPWVQSLAPHEADMMAQACNPSTAELEAGRSEGQSHPRPHETPSRNGRGKEGKRKPEWKNHQYAKDLRPLLGSYLKGKDRNPRPLRRTWILGTVKTLAQGDAVPSSEMEWQRLSH